MKKVLSFVLAICMLVALFSMAFTAFAAGEDGYYPNSTKVVILVAIGVALIVGGIAIYNNFMKD